MSRTAQEKQSDYKFAKLEFRDRYIMSYLDDQDKAIDPYLTAVCRYKEPQPMDEGINYQILDVISIADGKQAETGDWIYMDYMDFDRIYGGQDVNRCARELEMTDSDMKAARVKSLEYDEALERAPWTVTGRIYEDAHMAPDKMKQGFPRFDCLEERKFQYTAEDGVHSLDDLDKKMLQEHPDYYMGYNAAQEIHGGSFRLGAVPCGEYESGYWETFEGRRAYAQQKADELGVTLGPKEHDYQTGKLLDESQIMSQQEETQYTGEVAKTMRLAESLSEVSEPQEQLG